MTLDLQFKISLEHKKPQAPSNGVLGDCIEKWGKILLMNQLHTRQTGNFQQILTNIVGRVTFKYLK